jgi:hypothetical protein
METLIILLVFMGVPLALFSFIVFAAVHRARQQRKIYQAADKYINS